MGIGLFFMIGPVNLSRDITYPIYFKRLNINCYNIFSIELNHIILKVTKGFGKKDH